MLSLLRYIFLTFMVVFISQAHAAHIMLVSQMNGVDIKSDRTIQAYLQKKGNTVDLVDQSIDPSKIENIDLVLIYSTVAAKNLKMGWKTLPIPLMTWENDYLDDLAMTGKRIHSDFGEVEKERYLWLVNQPHSLSAHLNAGVVNVYKAQAPMSWGKPGLGAIIIATIYGQPEKPAIWGYEKGSTMDYESLAPARRLMFFLSNDTFNNLSNEGYVLFDAAIDWMLEK
ncbi:hypothetical protein I2F30_09650 [Acinetobacter sp. SCC474]|nr:hypothetical protein [Acinetobacter pollinis]MBF7697478.1 hypothetical protein [Acinetobacter pollinis]